MVLLSGRIFTKNENFRVIILKNVVINSRKVYLKGKIEYVAKNTHFIREMTICYFKIKLCIELNNQERVC